MTTDPTKNDKELLDQALERLGRPPADAIASARKRVFNQLRTTSPSPEDLALPLPEAKPASVWVLRKPFVIVAAAGLGLLAVSIVAVKTQLREQSPPEIAAVAPRLAPPLQPIEPSSVNEPAAPPPRAANSAPRIQRVRPRPIEPPVVDETVAQQTPVADVASTAPFSQDGKAILERACNACHSAEAVERERYVARADYEALVTRMTTKGAPLSPSEAATLVDYLFDQFKASPDDEAAKSVLARSCTGCHTLTGIEDPARDQQGYRDLVLRMASYGADLNPTEISSLTDYLFRLYGKK